MYRQVLSQKATIKRLLKEGDRERALSYTTELIEFQRRDPNREHVAKSLCDLASFVKKLGDTQLQQELSASAARECPTDAWSHAQLGEAQRALGDFSEAMHSFTRAGELGDDRAALLGRAGILKDLGQVEESLSVYDACIDNYPRDVVGRNGKAAALAAFGRFEESLRLYDELCDAIEIDPVSLTVRARDPALWRGSIGRIGCVSGSTSDNR